MHKFTKDEHEWHNDDDDDDNGYDLLNLFFLLQENLSLFWQNSSSVKISH